MPALAAKPAQAPAAATAWLAGTSPAMTNLDNELPNGREAHEMPLDGGGLLAFLTRS
jgi:hypothetical protein